MVFLRQQAPIQRRRSMHALFAFWRELKNIADGTEPRSVKRTLLSNWRDEIAHLYAGRPQHNVSKGLSEAIHRYGLRRSDLLAIIDGMEMDAQTDIRAPSFAELDRASWVLAQPALSDVCRNLAAIAERHYAAAEQALAGCPRWKTLPAAVTFGVYRALLHELLRRGWRHLDEPVQIPSWRGLSLVASSRSGWTLTN